MGGLQDNGSWMAPSSAPGGVNNPTGINLWRRWFLGGARSGWIPILYMQNHREVTSIGLYVRTIKAVGIKPQPTTC